MGAGPSRRPRKFNNNRKICRHYDSEKLAELANLVHYSGNQAHKRKKLGDFGLIPPVGARLYKTLCDGVVIHTRQEALQLLIVGITKGLISQQFRGEFPQNIWAVTDDGLPLEAMLSNRSLGTYHGYPIPQTDPFSQEVLKHWSQS